MNVFKACVDKAVAYMQRQQAIQADKTVYHSEKRVLIIIYTTIKFVFTAVNWNLCARYRVTFE